MPDATPLARQYALGANGPAVLKVEVNPGKHPKNAKATWFDPGKSVVLSSV